MKQSVLIITLFFISFMASAQSQTGTTTFNKAPQSSVIYDLPYSDEAVSNALENKMKAYGKAKKVKDFMVYKNIRISEISSDPLTVYFNVEKKSKKDKNNATLVMMLADDADNFYTAEQKPELFSKAKEYLDSFKAPVAAADLELQINGQDENLQKANKRLKKLRDDGIEYEKDKKKLEAKIADNIKEVEKQEKELASQKEQLDLLIKQRKN
jgi:hypothetical protein